MSKRKTVSTNLDESTVTEIVPATEPVTTREPIPLEGTILDLLDFGARRHAAMVGFLRSAILDFWELGVAAVEVHDRYERVNKGKSKSDPKWQSFGKALDYMGVTPSTANRAMAVARANPNPDKLDGVSKSLAYECATSLEVPPEDPFARAEKERQIHQQKREKALEAVKSLDRFLASEPPTVPLSTTVDPATIASAERFLKESANVEPKHAVAMDEGLVEDQVEPDDVENVVQEVVEMCECISQLSEEAQLLPKDRLPVTALQKALSDINGILLYATT